MEDTKLIRDNTGCGVSLMSAGGKTCGEWEVQTPIDVAHFQYMCPQCMKVEDLANELDWRRGMLSFNRWQTMLLGVLTGSGIVTWVKFFLEW